MLIIALILLLVFIWKRRIDQMSIFERLGIPGPKPNIIFGNAIDIFKHGTHQIFPEWTKKYGNIVGFYIGGRPQVLITDLDLIRCVMIKDFHLFSDRNPLIPGSCFPQPQLQKSVAFVQGNAWKKLRSTLTPSFSSSKLSTMEQLIMSKVRNLLNDLDEKINFGPELNLKPSLEQTSFCIATQCMLGLELPMYSMSNEAKAFAKAMRPQLDKSMLAMVMVLFPSLTFIAYPLRVWWETLRLRMLWSTEGVCYDVAKNIFLARKDSESKSNDLLQLLIDAKGIEPMKGSPLEMKSDNVIDVDRSPSNNYISEGLSEEDIVANVFFMLLAGFETVSVTLQFTIHNLVNNQDIQLKLRNELENAIKDNGGELNFKTILKVSLLNHVIKETLRLYPPGSPGTTRVAEENFQYQGLHIPKGMGVFIGVYSVHRDPKLWPEPDKFKPERFENEVDTITFLPFGAGPRNCIGLRFAYMELQLVLAHLILNYRFEPSPSTEKDLETIESMISLSPKNGVFCKLVKIRQ